MNVLQAPQGRLLEREFWTVMNSNPTPTPAAGVTGVLIHKDRITIYASGHGQDSEHPLHGTTSPFAPGELQGLPVMKVNGCKREDRFTACW